MFLSDESIQVSILGDLAQAKVDYYANQRKKTLNNGLGTVWTIS